MVFVQDEMWMWGFGAAVSMFAGLGLILSLLSKPQDNHHEGSGGDRKGWSATKILASVFMITLVAWISSVKPDYLPSLLSVVSSLLIGLGAWKRSLKYIFYAIFPVAYPGGPRKMTIACLAQHPDKEHEFRSGWKFLHAKESHEHTNARFKGSKLTGESAGRQIWIKEMGSSASLSPVGRKTPVRCSVRVHGNNRDQQQQRSFFFNPSRNPNAADIPLRQQQISEWTGHSPDEDFIPETAKEAARKGIEYYQMLQCDDGHWAGDYGGPMFLMPGLIIVYHVTGSKFDEGYVEAMQHYLRVHQQMDGGWGSHIEGASTMFGTVLNYVALRLLGVRADDKVTIRAQEFMHRHGGAIYTAPWAKFWLAILGVYEWEGISPVPPELWLLPRWFPFHPWKMWCHSRMVYLPMSFIYGKQWSYSGDKDPVVCALKNELYVEPYDSIDWGASRTFCSDLDVYSPVHFVLRSLQAAIKWYERWLLPFWPLDWVRRKGIEFAIEYVHEEDKQTNYIDIGPVNKCYNMMSTYINGVEDGGPETAFLSHKARVPDYLWVAEDGMRMNGYNGSQCWDTSFAIQAVLEGGFASEFPELCKKAWRYLNKTQIRTDEEQCDRFFRHVSKGGWPFSTSTHGWPISDCTAEGLKGVLLLSHECRSVLKNEPKISEERLRDTLNVLFTLQNHDGGWATYENNRGYGWYEMLSPAEVFGSIMIDYSYVETTSASLTALASFTKRYPQVMHRAIKRRITLGRRFIKSIQRPDGSWFGSWAYCFTYGTWFGIKGLRAAGEPTNSAAIISAVTFFLSHQNGNGGWGESHISGYNKSYGNGTASLNEGIDPGYEGSGVVQTAWACLGLMESGQAENETGVRLALDAGIDYLMSRQLPSGDWKQEGITDLGAWALLYLVSIHTLNWEVLPSAFQLVYILLVLQDVRVALS